MSDWLVPGRADPAAGARVCCFAYAGGDPRQFLDWQPALAADAEIVAVCPPGRGRRAAEPRLPIHELFEGAAEAIAAATAADGRPVYLFGHSLGGLVAFEVARRLRDMPLVRHLVASGIAAPSLLPTRRVRELAGLEGRAFAEALRFFGGVPPDVFADDDVLELLLPGLMADFRTAVQYSYAPAAPLAIGVTLIVGRDDPHVSAAHLERWGDECEARPARHWAAGGHFYFAENPSAATGLLRAIVRADQHVEVI